MKARLDAAQGSGPRVSPKDRRRLVRLRLVIYIAPGFSAPLSSHAPMSFATLLSVLLFALHWRLALCVSVSRALA